MACIACKALLVPILARLGSLLCHECKYDEPVTSAAWDRQFPRTGDRRDLWGLWRSVGRGLVHRHAIA